MEQYPQVDLYLDNDKEGRWCAYELYGPKGNSNVYHDCSSFYDDYKDYNAWWVSMVNAQRIRLRPGNGKHM